MLRALMTLTASTVAASARMFDTDCFPGSKCLKGAGSLYGVCAGGLFPGKRQRPGARLFGAGAVSKDKSS